MTGTFFQIAQVLAKRVSTPTTVTPPVGDGVPLQVDDEGHLWIRLRGDTRVTKILSGSTNGRPIQIPSGSITLHTATSTGGEIDQIWLWASNRGTETAVLTIMWGGATSTDKLEVPIAPDTTVSVAAGYVLQGGLSVTAEASVAAVVNVVGYVETVSS